MTAVSNVAIVNMALTKLGAERIASLDDDTKNAREAKAIYDLQRDAELRRHRWNFAIKRASLPALATPPAHGYTYAFQLPPDCLRVDAVGEFYPAHDLSDYRGADSRPYKIEGRAILSNDAGPLAIRYGARIDDPVQFDAAFIEAFACKLAFELALPITDSSSKKREAGAEYETAVRDARRLDAIEDPPEDQPDTSWITARL